MDDSRKVSFDDQLHANCARGQTAPTSLNPSQQVATRFVKARRLITETPWADRRKPNSAVLIHVQEVSHAFEYNIVPDIQDPDTIFSQYFERGTVSWLRPSGQRRIVATNPQHWYLEHDSERAVPPKFQIKWASGFLNITLTNHLSGKCQKNFLNLLRKIVFMTGMGSAHPSF